MHLLRGLEIARAVGASAQLLDGGGDVVGLRQVGVAQRLRPVELVAHHGQDLRHGSERLDAWIPGLLLHRAFERLAFHVRIVLGPARRLHHFERICGGGQDLTEKRIGIERDRRDQLGHLLGAERRRRRRRCALLSGHAHVAHERDEGEAHQHSRQAK